ncbi:hypothetical protein [Croceibacterium mercuriale]|uniref:hypothetical protein n=1 Tax=Croceibacterium mercuriale TaxID=1572751 RepID=UPI00190F3E60|nr:hypothetical protein [Croceibacterium mercuriale]
MAAAPLPGAGGIGMGTAGGLHQIELGAPTAVGAADPAVQARFDAALNAAGMSAPVGQGGEVPKVVGGLFDALDQVDSQAKSVSDYATEAQAGDGQLTPGEIVNLTMRCQEFMFQCQLTSNIANRSADGVQQLFRQQG